MRTLLINMTPTIDTLRKYWAKIWLPLTDEQKAAYAASVDKRAEIDGFVNTLQVPITDQASYTAAASQMVKIKQTHSGAIAKAEADIIKNTWEARGLSSAKLSSIMSFYNL